jgi:ABC-2 type transport system permease protein
MNNNYIALIKRDFLEGKGGYLWAPAIALGIAVFFSLLPILGLTDSGNVFVINADNVDLQEFLGRINEHTPEEISAGATFILSGFASLVWIPLPFVIVFTLLDQLYSERKDKSVLFWKSMPVSDTEEVLAKLIMPVFVAPIIYLGIFFVGTLIFALLLSIVSLFIGGPIIELWPIWNLVQGSIVLILTFFTMLLWTAPLLAWLMLVSAYAPKVPFIFAFAPPAFIIALEAIMFEGTRFAEWVGNRLGGWIKEVEGIRHYRVDDLEDLFRVSWDFLGSIIGHSLTSGSFWAGIIIAAAFLFGAIEIRKRAM